MSYVIVTKVRAYELTNNARTKVLEERNKFKKESVKKRMEFRKWWLGWCIPLRLFFGELSETEAAKQQYGVCGINWWELYGYETLGAAREIKQLADEADDGLVRISTEHMKYLTE